MPSLHYEIGRQSRENHPDQQKAVLYRITDETKELVAVWNPEKDRPKLIIPCVPQDELNRLKEETKAIRKEEEEDGFTFELPYPCG